MKVCKEERRWRVVYDEEDLIEWDGLYWLQYHVVYRTWYGMLKSRWVDVSYTPFNNDVKVHKVDVVRRLKSIRRNKKERKIKERNKPCPCSYVK